MKRFVICLMLLALAVGCFAGCAGTEPPVQPTEEPPVQTPTVEEPASESEPEEPSTIASAGDIILLPTSPASGGDLDVSDATLRVALVLQDTLGDGGYADEAQAGLEQLQTEYGESIEVQTIACDGNYYAEALLSAAGSADVVVCVGKAFSELERHAAKYPNVRWIWIGGAFDVPPANACSVNFAQNEGAYLAGFVAAASSESGVIGVVAGTEDEIARDYIAGFCQGAAVRSETVQVETAFTGSETDPDAARAAALSLCDKGADVVLQLVSDGADGVFAAAEERDCYLIGTGRDRKALSDRLVLCSVVLNVKGAVHDLVLNCLTGDESAWGTNWIGTLMGGYVYLGYGEAGATQLVPNELQAETDELTLQIIMGDVVVDTAR